MAKFDTHHHVWNLGHSFTNWPTPELAAIYRDFSAADLAPLLDACGIDGTILIQAAPAVAETEYLLRIAEASPFVKGVVGWIDFESPDALSQLAIFAENPFFRGVRPMMQDQADERWISHPRFEPILDALTMRELRFDALVRSSQLGDVTEMASRYADLPIVLDHGGKPAIAEGLFAIWADGIERLARLPNVYCKLSGLWAEAGSKTNLEAIEPYVGHLLQCFGARRLMWGSDWPVVQISGRYDAWLSQCEALLEHLPESDREHIFGINGRRFYGIA